MKHYLVNTPLILQDENGEDVRVERGEIIELSDTQYAEVAAHVTPVDMAEETENEQPENPPATTESQTETPPAESANATTSTHLADEQPENPDTDKPKRGKVKE